MMNRLGTTVLKVPIYLFEGVATSSFRITWMIDRARLNDAVRLLHATFIQPLP